MHARDISAGSQNEERNDRNKLSQHPAQQQLPITHAYEPSRSYAADLSKAEVAGSRTCGVTLQAPPDAHSLRREPWSIPDHGAYRYTAAAQAPTTEHLYPQRNISPRQTFQENMRRILVPPRSDMSKIVPETSEPLVNFPLHVDETISKNFKMNTTSDSKYCDVPYLTNPPLKQQGASAIRHSDVYASAAMRGWSAPTVYYPPEYYTPRSTKPPLEKIESPQPFGENIHRNAPVRYEPYPSSKEKYPRARYEYVNFPNSYQPYLPTPHKYDSIKPVAPPRFVNYTPQKYVDPRIVDPHSETYSRPAQHIRGFNAAQTGDYISAKLMLPNSHYPLQSKFYGYPMDPSIRHLPTAVKSTYDVGRSYYEYDYGRIKPLQASDNPYMSEVPSHGSRPQYPIHNYPPNNGHPKAINYFYHHRNDHIAMKSYPEQLAQYKCADLRQNAHNPLARIPAQFSPNIISPAESNTSTESAPALGTPHEDCGYASQGSTASGKSFDIPHYKIHQYDHSVNDNRAFASLHGNHMKNPREYLQNNENTSIKDNKNIDVRQFLQMWDEHDEDEVTKSKDAFPVASITIEPAATPAGQQQLYVLDMVNIPSEEIDKYGHIQKVCKLPENIRGYDSADLLNKFDEAFRPSPSIDFGSRNIQQEFKSNIQKELKSQISMVHNARPPSPFDVEAKITQSVIHKDVGCNFEIRPCSPSVKGLDVVSAIEPNERKIEKIINEHIVQPITSNPSPPIVDASLRLKGENNSLKNGEKRKSLENDSEKNSKIMRTVESKFGFNSDEGNYVINEKEYGTVSGECLASLPRLDNEIEYFTEINEQYSDSKTNKETVIINAANNAALTLHDDTNKNMLLLKPSKQYQNNNKFNSKEGSKSYNCQINSFSITETGNVNNSQKLSKFRKTKTLHLLEINNDEASIKPNSLTNSPQQNSPIQRTDSVIIKNPDSLECTMSVLDECVKSPECVTQSLQVIESKRNSKNKSVWAHSFTHKIKATDFIDTKKSNAECGISQPIREMFSLPGSSPINLIMHGPPEDYTDCIRPSLIHCIGNESSTITNKDTTINECKDIINEVKVGNDSSKPNLNEIPLSVAINLSIHSNQLDLYPSNTDPYELQESCKEPHFSPKCNETNPDCDTNEELKSKEEIHTMVSSKLFLDGENNKDKIEITTAQSPKSNSAVKLYEVENEHTINESEQKKLSLLNSEQRGNENCIERLNESIVSPINTEVLKEESSLNDNCFGVDVDEHIEENIENIALHIMATSNIFTKDTSENESLPMPVNNGTSFQNSSVQGLLNETFSGNWCDGNEVILDKGNRLGTSETIENKENIQSDCSDSIIKNNVFCETFDLEGGKNDNDDLTKLSIQINEEVLVTQSANVNTKDCEEKGTRKVECETVNLLCVEQKNIDQPNNIKIPDAAFSEDCNDIFLCHANNFEPNNLNSQKYSLSLVATAEINTNLHENVQSLNAADEVVSILKENQITEMQNVSFSAGLDTLNCNDLENPFSGKSDCKIVSEPTKGNCEIIAVSSSNDMKVCSSLPMLESESCANTTSEKIIKTYNSNHIAQNTITNVVSPSECVQKIKSIKDMAAEDNVTLEDRGPNDGINHSLMKEEIACIAEAKKVEYIDKMGKQIELCSSSSASKSSTDICIMSIDAKIYNNAEDKESNRPYESLGGLSPTNTPNHSNDTSLNTEHVANDGNESIEKLEMMNDSDSTEPIILSVREGNESIEKLEMMNDSDSTEPNILSVREGFEINTQSHNSEGEKICENKLIGGDIPGSTNMAVQENTLDGEQISSKILQCESNLDDEIFSDTKNNCNYLDRERKVENKDVFNDEYNPKDEILNTISTVIENTSANAILTDSYHISSDLTNSGYQHFERDEELTSYERLPDRSLDIESTKFKHTNASNHSTDLDIHLHQNMCTEMFGEIAKVKSLPHSLSVVKVIQQEVKSENDGVQCNNNLCKNISNEPLKSIITSDIDNYCDVKSENQVEEPKTNMASTSKDSIECNLEKYNTVLNNLENDCSSDSIMEQRTEKTTSLAIHKENIINIEIEPKFTTPLSTSNSTRVITLLHNENKVLMSSENKLVNADIISIGNKCISADIKNQKFSLGNDEFECCKIKAFDSENILVVGDTEVNKLALIEKNVENNDNLKQASTFGCQNNQENILTSCFQPVTEPNMTSFEMTISDSVSIKIDQNPMDNTIDTDSSQVDNSTCNSDNVVPEKEDTKFGKIIKTPVAPLDKIINKNILALTEKNVENNDTLNDAFTFGCQNNQENIFTSCFQPVTEANMSSFEMTISDPVSIKIDQNPMDSTFDTDSSQVDNSTCISDNVVPENEETKFEKNINTPVAPLDKITNKNIHANFYIKTQIETNKDGNDNVNDQIKPKNTEIETSSISDHFENNFTFNATESHTSSVNISSCITSFTDLSNEKAINHDGYQKTNNFLEFEYNHKEHNAAQDSSMKCGEIICEVNNTNKMFKKECSGVIYNIQGLTKPPSEVISVDKITNVVIPDQQSKYNENIVNASADNFISTQMSLIKRKNCSSRWDMKSKKGNEELKKKDSQENTLMTSTQSVSRTIIDNTSTETTESSESLYARTDVTDSDSMELSSHLSFIFENLSKKRRLSDKGHKVKESNSSKCAASHHPSTIVNYEDDSDLPKLNYNMVGTTNNVSVSKIAKLFFDDKETETQKLRKILISDENIQRNINSDKYVAKWRNLDCDSVQQNMLEKCIGDVHTEKNENLKGVLPEAPKLHDTNYVCSEDTTTKTHFPSKVTSKTDMFEEGCEKGSVKYMYTKDGTDENYSDKSLISKSTFANVCPNNLILYDEQWSKTEASVYPNIKISPSSYDKNKEEAESVNFIVKSIDHCTSCNDEKSEMFLEEVNTVDGDIKIIVPLKIDKTFTCVKDSQATMNEEEQVNAVKNVRVTAGKNKDDLNKQTAENNFNIEIISEQTEVRPEILLGKNEVESFVEINFNSNANKVIQNSADTNHSVVVNTYMEPDSTQECHGQTNSADRGEKFEPLVNFETNTNEVNIEVNNNNNALMEQIEHKVNKDLEECDSSQTNVFIDTEEQNKICHSQLDSNICHCHSNSLERQECSLMEDVSALTEINTVQLTYSCNNDYKEKNENVQINMLLGTNSPNHLNSNDDSDACENSTNVEYEEIWIDDVACVETVVSEDIIDDGICSGGSLSDSLNSNMVKFSEYDNETEKSKFGLSFDSTKIKNIYGNNMDTNEINLVETLYRTPYMNVQSKLNDPDHIPSKLRSNETLQDHNKIHKLIDQDFNASDCHDSFEVHLDMVDKAPSSVKKLSVVPIPENIKDTLRIEYSRCKVTDSYADTGRSNRLITKAAQKYIPPLNISSHDLKVKLPLPEERLETLKHLKTKQRRKHERSPIPKLKIRTTNITKDQGESKYTKKLKPKFEDVLKQIDETQYSVNNMKLRNRNRSVKAVPKVIIKKSENGSHYTSTPVKKNFDPDLTGNKWQPWVRLEKCILIEKILAEGKTHAVFCHDTKIFIISNKNHRKEHLVSFIGKKTQYSLDFRKKPLKCENAKHSEEYIPKSNHPAQGNRTYYPTPRQQRVDNLNT